MIFNELTYYLAFLLPSLVAFHLSRRLLSPRVADVVRPLVLASFGFAFFVYYGFVHFGGFVGSLMVLIFVWELFVSRFYRKGSRFCVAGIVQAVAILFVFKYLRFFAASWNDLASAVGSALPRVENLPNLGLPLGISFFTFEFIHFAADVHSGKIAPPRMPNYAAFIFFFPTMVAGPIKRFDDFEPQLVAARFEPRLVSQGITRVLAGLAKKHVLADTAGLFAQHLNGPELFHARPIDIVVWLLGYTAKIYFDFSAYSDIAIGSGYLFGLHVPENFDWPYASANIPEFWRRWHISLGGWIRDYVYIPLGGSRKGEARTALNLVAAFGVSGLWHGAAYNFVAWGLWHGGWMAAHRLWTKWAGRPQGRLWHAMSIAGTFVVVVIGWALFSMDLSRALVALRRVAGGA